MRRSALLHAISTHSRVASCLHFLACPKYLATVCTHCARFPPWCAFPPRSLACLPKISLPFALQCPFRSAISTTCCATTTYKLNSLCLPWFIFENLQNQRNSNTWKRILFPAVKLVQLAVSSARNAMTSPAVWGFRARFLASSSWMHAARVHRKHRLHVARG